MDATNFGDGIGKIAVFTLHSFSALAFLNGLEDRNADARSVSGDDSPIVGIYRNLMSFCPVTPEYTEFTRLSCVHEASISTGVSSTALARNNR